MADQHPQSLAWTTAMVRNPHLLAMTIILLLVAGWSAWQGLPRIEDPRITMRNATIITTLPGASAKRIEALVSKPIEDELRQLAEIKTIESTSRSGVSVVAIELQDWVGPRDNELIFSKVRDRLGEVRLPAGSTPPDFDDKRGAVAYSLILALSWRDGQTGSLGALNRIAQDLGDRLRGLSGSDQIVYFGAPTEEVQVSVDPEELAATGLTPAQLARRLALADAKRPAGAVRSARRDIAVEIRGELDTVQRIATIPIGEDNRGGLLQLRDIAQIRKTVADPPEQIALHQGGRAVLVAVSTTDDIRLDRWASKAKARIGAFQSDLDENVSITTVFDQSAYTDRRLAELGGNLLEGAIVVVLVVLVTMGWRRALFVGAALPLSAGATLFGLTFFGEQIHQMSIFGMIIAIGLLIDNAIVMTDAVSERLRAGQTRTAAVAAASRHLLVPLFASTLTTILGFMPIFLLPGNVGDFVGPIAISVVLALIASFALSMTVIPALVAHFASVQHDAPRRWWRDGLNGKIMAERYRRVLRVALARPAPTLLLVALPPALGFGLASQLGMQFFPPADRDQVEIQVFMPAGASVYATAKTVEKIEAVVRQQPQVQGLTWVVGASSPPVYYNQLRDEDHNPTHARAVVQVSDAAFAKALERELQQSLPPLFTDAQVIVKAFGQGPPIKAPVAFRIIGPDLERLREYGERLRALLHEHPQVVASRAAVAGGEPKLWLAADQSQAQLAGLSLGDLAEQFRAALDGAVGGLVLEDLQDLPVRVRFAAADRGDVATLATLHLLSDDAPLWVPVEAIGEFELQPELAKTYRRNSERVNEVLGFLRQGALPIEVARTLGDRLAAGALDLGPGYRLETAGDSAEQQNAIGQLLTYVPVLGVLMVATLVLTFRSTVLAGLIGIVALLSVGLGMLSLWFGGFPLGFNPIIGSAGLIGVAINGSIVVLAAIRANARARAGDAEAIIAETLGATRHIFSTTLTTVAGFMPLLLLSGGDFWPPLAIVIAGGVGLSAVLSLVFTPTVYRLIYARQVRHSAAAPLLAEPKTP